MAKELSKDTITFWRHAAESPHFEAGLAYLASVHKPRPKRTDDTPTQHHDTLCGTGYEQAIEDVREKLTNYVPAELPSPEIERLQQ